MLSFYITVYRYSRHYQSIAKPVFLDNMFFKKAHNRQSGYELFCSADNGKKGAKPLFPLQL